MDSNKRPFISIIMICYNYGHLLSRPLEMIAKQTFRDFELVFVDNGCTDNSVEIIKAFAKEHEDIYVKIITVEENIGLPHGDNIGANQARGEYYLFHDADDWMDENTLEILANAAKSNNADRVISSFRDVDENGKVIQLQEIVKENPIYWLYGMQQANLFKGDIYRKENFKVNENSFWVDADKTIRFSHYVKNVAYVYEPCYNYLVHTDSFSRNKDIYKLIWTEKYSFENLLKSCYEVYELENDENKVWIEYMMINEYFSYMFQFLRDAPIKEKWKNYTKLHQVMKSVFPNYLKNPKLSLKWKGGKRMYARRIAWMATTLEKLQLMKVGLLGYHILSKFKYFQV